MGASCMKLLSSNAGFGVVNQHQLHQHQQQYISEFVSPSVHKCLHSAHHRDSDTQYKSIHGARVKVGAVIFVLFLSSEDFGV